MLIVRQAVLEDVTAMGEVFARTFRAAHRDQVPEHLLLQRTPESSASGWDRTLRALAVESEPEESVWVALDGGEVVGLAMGGPAHPWPSDDAARARRRTAECWLLY